MKLQTLAANVRFMQLFGHHCHNTIKGETFFVDHPELASFYGTYEDIYDAIVERAIGIDEEIDLIEIQKEAVSTLIKANIPDDFTGAFKALLSYENYICKEIEKILEGYSEGTRQFLGNICDQSEARQFKLKQRIG